MDGELVAKMTATMAHRGPDAGDVWTDGVIGLGHRRLRIVDLLGGQQRMVSHETGVVISFNGEIYNFRALQEELAGLGSVFRHQSDTEVILKAYETWGDRCVERFQGMFAFAIWDPGRRRLFVARDRFGIKPFYYSYDGGRFCFSSEIKGLLAVPWVSREIDPDAMEEFLSRQYVPGPGTIFRKIDQCVAGHRLVCDRTGVSQAPFWCLRQVPHGLIGEDLAKETLSRFRKAVQEHLVSDVSVGAFLSGGLDSSLVVGLMQREASKPIKTFSVGIKGLPAYSELSHARKVARWFGTEHHDLMLGPDAVISHLQQTVEQMDEPFADYAALPTYLLSRLASRYVKVVLTGEGADELFGGYRRYLTSWIPAHFRQWRRLPARVWRSLLIRSAQPPTEAAKTAEFGGNHEVWESGESLEKHLGYRSTYLFRRRELRGLLEQSRRREKAMHGDSPHRESGQTSGKGDLLNQFMRADIQTWLPDNLLKKVDRMSMLASVEARVPYLDHEFVEFVMSIPGSVKIDPWRQRTKVLLKSVAQGLLPPEIIHRKKQGFTVPVNEWLRDELRELSHDLLLSSSARFTTFCRRAAVLRLLREHQEGRPHGRKIWGLLVLEMWCQATGVG